VICGGTLLPVLLRSSKEGILLSSLFVFNVYEKQTEND
jgi:hypothetical protein